MRKSKLLINCLLSFVFLSSLSAAEKIIIAPVLYYNSDNTIELQESNLNARLSDKLNEAFYVSVLQFIPYTDESIKINSALDAQHLCISQEKNYVLYGFIRNQGNSWYAEIKLFNNIEQRQVKEFFVCDDIDNYDRFLNTLCNNIIQYFSELFCTENFVEEENIQKPLLIVPAQILYWTPLDGNWNSHIIGISGINSGIEFFPQMDWNFVNYKKINFSTALNVSYRFAVGNPQYYSAFCNEISLDAAALIHYNFNEKNSVFIGIAPGYRLMVYNIEPKYDSSQAYVQNRFTISMPLGFDMGINELCTLDFGLKPGIEVSNSPRVTIQAEAGVKFKVWKGSEK